MKLRLTTPNLSEEIVRYDRPRLVNHPFCERNHKFFVITGHYIIMGRKTFETFPKLLPNRIHVVITRNTAYKAEGVIVVHTIEDALEVAKSDQQPFIIGGGEIYTMGMKHADCIELTRVHGEFEADAFFPEIDMNDWKLVKEEFHDKDDRHKYPFTYLTYKRK